MTNISIVWPENIGTPQMGRAVAIVHDRKRGTKVLALNAQGVYFLISPTEIAVNMQQQQDTSGETTGAQEVGDNKKVEIVLPNKGVTENDQTGKSEQG